MFQAVRGHIPALLVALLFAGTAIPARADDPAAPTAEGAASSDTGTSDGSSAAPAGDADKPAGDTDSATADSPSDADKPTADKPTADKPTADTAATAKPSDDKAPAADAAKPAADASGDAHADKASTDDSTTTTDDSAAKDSDKAADDSSPAPAPGTLAPTKHPAPSQEKPAQDEASDDEGDDNAAPDNAPPAKMQAVGVLSYAPINGDVPQSTGDKVADLLRDEVTKAHVFKLVQLGAASGGSEKAAGASELATAKAQVAEALAHLDKVKSLIERRKIKPAADASEKGIAQFLHNFQGAESFKPLSDAYARLAVIRFMQGNDDASNRALDDLIRIDPTRTLSADDFKALSGTDVADALVDRFKKERRTMFGKARGDVRIESMPAGGRIMIDGASVGETPLLAKSLLPGDHFILVTKDGVGAFWKQVSVKAGSITVTAALSADATGPLAQIAKKLDRNVFDAGTRDAIKAAGVAAGADFVVVGGIKSDGDSLTVKSFVVRTSDGAVAELAALSLDPSLLGAGIEVVKVNNDLMTKVQTTEFAAEQSLSTLFDGVAATPEAAEAVTEVVITPPATEAGRGSQEAAESGTASSGTSSHHRGPVTPESESHHRGPVTAGSDAVQEAAPPKVEENPASNESALQQLEERRRARQKAQHGRAVRSEEAPEPQATPEQEEATPSDGGDAEAPKQQKKEMNINVPDRSDQGASGLTVEQLQKLNQAQQEHGNAGKIVLWTGVGVVGAAAIAAGAYFIFRPTSPSSATATVRW